MRYLLMIYGNEAEIAGTSPEQGQAVMAAWWQYTSELEQAGKRINGEALQPSTTATTIRGALVTDGPFAEAKEQLGGYYLIEADDLDDAISWAKRMPHVPYGGSVEIRPILDLTGTQPA